MYSNELLDNYLYTKVVANGMNIYVSKRMIQIEFIDTLKNIMIIS